MNIFKILSMAFFAILTLLIGMAAYLYVVTELHSDIFVGICAFLITTVVMTMIYCSIRWAVVDAYPKIKKSRKKPMLIFQPPENPGPALEKVLKYIQDELSTVIRDEDIPLFTKIAEDFVNRKTCPTTYEVDRDTSGLKPIDILHFGHNLKGLSATKWTGPQVAKFLKKAFPRILDNYLETTISAKLKQDDSTCKITLLSDRL